MRPPAVAADATQFWLRRTNVCRKITSPQGHVAELVGIEGGVVSGVINLESSGV
jgi:hypothetical protein